MKRFVFNPIYILIILLIVSCSKSDFLNKSPDNSLKNPSTAKDLQALLDNFEFINRACLPVFGEASSDDYYILNFGTLSAANANKNLYCWRDDIYTQETMDYFNTQYYSDWSKPYEIIFYANEILESSEKLSKSSSDELLKNVKGSALFLRAFMFFSLSQIFAPVYDENTAKSDLGIVLNLSPDIYAKSTRSTLFDTYQQIIKDLKNAKELLPNLPLDGYRSRPSKAAVEGLLARIYLSMGINEAAWSSADSALKLYSNLIDYNEGKPAVFKRINDETIFYSELIPLLGLFSSARYRVDSTLYNQYNNNDLRKSIFFVNSTNGRTFGGNYTGTTTRLFGGIATDELYLIRAEANARLGRVQDSMNDLNYLMKRRWNKSSSFPEFTASSQEDAIQKILTERRKELLFRGIRWIDLRRLNKMGSNITLKRKVDQSEFILSPNDLHYTLQIPLKVLSYNPDMPLNPR